MSIPAEDDVMADIEEEIEVLESIYCERSEFKLLQEGIPAILSIAIPDVQVSGTEDTPEAIHLTATFTLNVGYPDVIPGMSFQSNSFNHKQLQDLKREACVYAQTLLGNVMVMEIVMWIQENVKYLFQLKKQQTAQSEATPPNTATWLIQIDHMRARTAYTRTICGWIKELHLSGRLFFCKRAIYLLIQGEVEQLKDYLCRHKTQTVDIDSRGRPCKERMLTVLCQRVQIQCNDMYTDFKAVEFEDRNELQRELSNRSLIFLTEFVT